MNRFLFEFEDKKWFPKYLRTYMTDYLQFIFSSFNLYEPVLPILHQILIASFNNTIVDICSGSGGPLFRLKKEYEKRYNSEILVRLTDKYIPLNAETYLPKGVTYEKKPLTADNIPQDVQGLRTMFSSLHHFSPSYIENILLDAVKKDQPVAFFDSGNKGIMMILAIIFLHPIGLTLLTPLIKPLSFRRLFFTYVIPLVIFFTIWDGIISILKLHDLKVLTNISKSDKLSYYKWSIGSKVNRFGMKIVYIVGISKKQNVENI